MLQRAWSDGPRATLAGTRILRVGGHVFESIGRSRVDSIGADERARLRVRAERMREVAADLCRVHGFELHVEGVLPPRPVVMVANHVSYIDAPVLASLAPCTAIAKGEVRRWPLVGTGAQALGVLFVARGDAWSGALALRRAYRALLAGVSVLGFPEGTTTRGDDVLPFRRGMFGLAQICNVPVVPIAIHYTSPELPWYGDSWFLPHYLRTAMRPRSAVMLRIGAPIAPRALRSPEELANRARSATRALLWKVRA